MRSPLLAAAIEGASAPTVAVAVLVVEVAALRAAVVAAEAIR